MTKPKLAASRPSKGSPEVQGKSQTFSFKDPTSRSRIIPWDNPYWMTLDPGQSLGYRKGKRQGTWLARTDSPRLQTVLGRADDGLGENHLQADGRNILTFAEAKAKALAWFKAQARVPEGQKATVEGRYTVGDALRAYMEVKESQSIESFPATKSRIEKTISEIGHIKLCDLNSFHLTDWMGKLIKQPPRVRTKKGEAAKALSTFDPNNPEHKRRRQCTVNRALADVKAALNMVYSGANGWIDSDAAWKGVTGYENVDASRDAILDLEQQAAFLNAASPEFRPLAYAALLTGQRYGPLRRLLVGDFDPANRRICVSRDKAGSKRFAPLSDEALIVFWAICEGRAPEEPMLLRANGKPWGKGTHLRSMEETSKAIDVDITLYGLRHTYITTMLLNGVDVALIAEAVNTSSEMIHKNYKHFTSESIGARINAKAPRLGRHHEEAAILEKIKAMQSKRVEGKLELTFTLASLHPSSYAGLAKGGRVLPEPPPNRPTREELAEMIQELPATQIGKKYGVSDKTVEKWCRKWGLEKPGRGHWAKKYAQAPGEFVAGRHSLENEAS